MSVRFGTDGIRGVANVELTPELALALGRAAARHLASPSFLVGADTRRSASMLKSALAAGITAEGSSVVDLGVVTTPAVAWLAARHQVPGAMISASHNPFEDNGIKLFSAGGSKLEDGVERAIEAEIERLDGRALQPDERGAPSGAAIGELVADPGLLEDYLEYLVASVELPAATRLRVVCDCANGSASAIAPEVLRRLGLDVVVVADRPDGLNINAGCGATAPENLAAAVLEHHADLGLGLDGDADRLIAADDLGAIVDGDRLLALFAKDLHGRGELENKAIVVTVMSNLGLRRALAAEGIDVVETPVGDRHVVVALEENHLVLGGEQSGHIVFRREATTGDGILTGLKLIELVARSRRPLAELAASAMTRLPQELVSVRVAQPRRLSDAMAIWDEVAAIERELAGEGRVLLRASGTEPSVRVMVEAETHEIASRAVERLVDVVEHELG